MKRQGMTEKDRIYEKNVRSERRGKRKNKKFNLQG